MLGDAEFSRVLHKFIADWHGKHPLPWDMFNSFNATHGRDLNWFFKSWYFDNGYIDLAVDGVAKTNGGYNVTIKNIGGFVAPVNVIVQYSDGSTESLHQTSAIWTANQRQTTVKIATPKTINAVTLDGGIWMDANAADNKWPAP
jgi:aminopeptidase N